MSTFVVDARRAERDPGRMYPPPPITAGGWALRWGITAVFLLAVILTMLISRFIPVPGEDLTFWASPVRIGLDVLCTGVAFWLITKRRSRPVLVFSLLVLSSIISDGAGAFVPWATVSLATRRRWREVVPMLVLFVVVSLLTFAIPGYKPNITIDDEPVEDIILAAGIATAMGTLWMLVLVAVGFYVGARRDLVASLVERAETAEREQRLKVEAGKAGERARIAREMHDVLAHRISLVSMHAGVLAYRDDLEPAKTREIAGIIQENAHASLSELRQVLATLREPTDGAGGVEKPQPTLSDLDSLLEEARQSGVGITFDDQLAPDAVVPPAVARHAYRMMQESLTNARKHALGAQVQITLRGRPGKGLSLEVRNPLTADTGVPGAKLGLVGLGERAQIMGGTFEAGPEQGDFVVRAWLPWQK